MIFCAVTHRVWYELVLHCALSPYEAEAVIPFMACPTLPYLMRHRDPACIVRQSGV